MTKYCYDSSSGYEGFTDDYTVLLPEDDAASVALGSNWRMPTNDEWIELCENCKWTWAKENGVNGMKVTSNKNSNSIFLPVTSYYFGTFLDYDEGSSGYYWSSSVHEDYTDCAFFLHFHVGAAFSFYIGRAEGLTVRPVYAE